MPVCILTANAFDQLAGFDRPYPDHRDRLENKKFDRDGGERGYFGIGLSSVYIKKASTAHAVDAFFEMLGFGEHFNSDVDHFVQSHKRQADFGASFSFIDLFNNAFHSFKRP